MAAAFDANPIGLAANWIAVLSKRWVKIRQTRKKDIESIVFLFGGDPEMLHRRYIEPDCQPNSPSDYHEDGPIAVFRQPIGCWINAFLEKVTPFEACGQNVAFVLGDAGMGKTSLLVMLKFTHMLKFWPDGIDFRLLKICDETIGMISEIESRRQTVLLLDALDEDRAAQDDIEGRVLELLDESKGFRNVIITCRTQFFPKGHMESLGRIEVRGYNCNLVYLALFSNDQVNQYLRKVYKDQQKFQSAFFTVMQMKSLKMRPLILSYIEDLEGVNVYDNSFKIYEMLVLRWLWREQRKLREIRRGECPTAEQLLRACEDLAIELQVSGRRDIQPIALENLISSPAVDNLKSLDVKGRSLLNIKSDGSFRFAHYSIQEFLVVHSIVEDVSNCGRKIHATELIWEFLRGRAQLASIPDLRGILRLLSGKVFLADTDLQGVDLSSENLYAADLRNVNLDDADLSDANLRDADLSGASLRGTHLGFARLSGTNLRNVDLSDAKNLTRAQLSDAVIGIDTMLPLYLSKTQ